MKVCVDEMPKECWDCPCLDASQYCSLQKRNVYYEINGCRASNCPLHSITEVQNEKAIECLHKVKDLIIQTYEPTPKSTKITRFINQLIAELKGEKDDCERKK